MRRKLVTRSEIRFDGAVIRTLPADTVRIEVPDPDLWWREYIVPIPRLWAPLLRELSDWRKRKAKERHQFVINAGLSPRAWEPPEPVRLAKRYDVDLLRLRPCTCQRCGREFYRLSDNGRYCSDDCAKASWREGRAGSVAAVVKARSEERAAARADRRCANPACNKPLSAQRSTMKFCSVRCRVAAHRESKRDATT